MRRILLLFLFALPVVAAPEGWHTTLGKGLEAAKKSGKPLFVATMWKRGTELPGTKYPRSVQFTAGK